MSLATGNVPTTPSRRNSRRISNLAEIYEVSKRKSTFDSETSMISGNDDNDESGYEQVGSEYHSESCTETELSPKLSLPSSPPESQFPSPQSQSGRGVSFGETLSCMQV